MMVSGSAMIYRIRLVKLNSSDRFPKTPNPSEMAFKTVTHRGSAMSTPASSAPSGSCPLFGNSTLHLDARAAIERTLASGPRVAARSGIVVDANHHCLRVSVPLQGIYPRDGSYWGRSSDFPRSLNLPTVRMLSAFSVVGEGVLDTALDRFVLVVIEDLELGTSCL